MAHSLKTVFVLFLIAVTAGFSYAQDDADIVRPSTKSGSAAWIFAFGGLTNLQMGAVTITDVNSLTGAGPIMGAGFKMFIADDMAIRAVLGFNTSSSGDKDKNGSTSSTTIGIAAGLELHTPAVYSISPYFGALISFGTSSSHTEITAGPVDRKTSGSIFGIGALAGFDWYFTRGLAIGGEYSLGFASVSGSTPGPTAGSTIDQPSSTMIGIASGNVHLIVHF